MYKPTPHNKARDLQARGPDGSIRWCEPGTETYVEFGSRSEKFLYGSLAFDTHKLIDKAVASLDGHIKDKGDGVIGDNFVEYYHSTLRRQGWVVLTAQDANEHNLTYGVLKAALQALEDYMVGSVILKLSYISNPAHYPFD